MCRERGSNRGGHHLPLFGGADGLVAATRLDLPEHLVQVQLPVCKRHQLVLPCARNGEYSSGYEVQHPPPHDMATSGAALIRTSKVSSSFHWEVQAGGKWWQLAKARTADAVVVVDEHVGELLPVEAAQRVQDLRRHFAPRADRDLAPRPWRPLVRQRPQLALQLPAGLHRIVNHGLLIAMLC